MLKFIFFKRINMIKKIVELRLFLFEKILVTYLSILTLLVIVFAQPFGKLYGLILLNLLYTMLILNTAYLEQNYSYRVFKFARYWLPVFLFIFLYEETDPLMHLFHPGWFDGFFALIDQTIFSVNLGLWIEQFDYPALNELFRFGYASYYLIIFLGAYVHYFHSELSEYISMLSQVTLAFCLSYLSFIIIPVQGPRFYHADLFSTNMDGLIFSHIQQKIIEWGSLRGAAFPSSHIAVALIIWFSFFRRHRSLFFILTPLLSSFY